MAQFVVVPEPVEDLLLLHVGAELFLFDLRALALERDDLGAALLRLFLGAGALALQLQPSGADPGDLRADVGDAAAHLHKLVFFFLQARKQAFDLALACLHGRAARLAVAQDRVQQGSELRDAVFRRALLRLKRGARAALLGLIGERPVQLEADVGEIRLGALKLRGAAACLFFQAFCLGVQALQLVGAGEDAAVFRAAAAGHGAAGVDQLAVERHDAQAVAARLRHAYGVAQALRDHGAAEEVFENMSVSFLKAHELDGHADKARIVRRRVVQHLSADRVQRQEGRAPGVAALEEFDRVFAVVLAVHDDVLRRGAQGRLDGERTGLFRLQQLGCGTVHALERTVLRLAHDAAHGAGIALVILFHLLEHGDPRLGAFQLDGQRVRPLGQLAEQLLAVCQLQPAAVDDVERLRLARGGLLELAFDGGDPLFILRDLRAQLPGAALLLVHILLQAIGGLARALDVGADDRGGGLALARGALRRGEAVARLLGFDVLAVHALGDAAGRGVERLEARTRLFQALRDLLVFKLHALALGVQTVQRGHPGGDLADLQFVAQHEIALGDLALFLERADLQLQLVDLVVDTQQVLLGPLQLALRLLLAVAVARDAGGLLEDLAAVGALGGDDLRDAALADDGIAVAAQARVHQQAVDVLEPHALAVDEILALAAAVIAAREDDLGGVALENMRGVVNDQRYLRIAELAALFGAAENHVLHLAAAQGARTLLAHDPQDRVGKVGLARAVGSDDSGDILFKRQARLVRKGLEALDLQCF